MTQEVRSNVTGYVAVASVVFGVGCRSNQTSGVTTTTGSATSARAALRGGTCPASPRDIAAFRSCRGAKVRADCEREGGLWHEFARMSGGPMYGCVCPAPDEGCPCNFRHDCADACIVGMSERCDAKAEAHCTSTAPFGCTCFVDDDGKRQAWCVD
jgi:hypothetical protein